MFAEKEFTGRLSSLQNIPACCTSKSSNSVQNDSMELVLRISLTLASLAPSLLGIGQCQTHWKLATAPPLAAICRRTILRCSGELLGNTHCGGITKGRASRTCLCPSYTAGLEGKVDNEMHSLGGCPYEEFPSALTINPIMSFRWYLHNTQSVLQTQTL